MKEAKRLSVSEFAGLVRGGGWFVTGGHKVRRESSPVTFLVTGLTIDNQAVGGHWTSHTLHIKACGHGAPVQYEIPGDEVFLTDLHTVQICRVILDRRLLRRNEGGGFHDVPVIEVLLRLTKKS